MVREDFATDVIAMVVVRRKAEFAGVKRQNRDRLTVNLAFHYWRFCVLQLLFAFAFVVVIDYVMMAVMVDFEQFVPPL